MSKNQTTNYDRGDWIVHCYYGVGQIKDIECKRLGDQENTYYRIRTEDSTFWMPVDKIDNGQIRPVADKSDFHEAVEVLNRPPREMSSNLSTRISRIKKVVVENTPSETARLIRDLRARRQEKGGLNQSERQALHDLTKQFVQEWSVCQSLSTRQRSRGLNQGMGRPQRVSDDHARTTSETSEVPSMLYALINQDDAWSDWLAKQLA